LRNVPDGGHRCSPQRPADKIENKKVCEKAMHENIRIKNTAYISCSALTKNYRAIEAILRENTPGGNVPRIIATVKADGYGHGVDTVTRVLGDAGCDFFAVSSEAEALEVRTLEAGRGRHPRILILGYTFPENAPVLAGAGIECAAVSPEHARALAEGTDGPLTVHIKLDTGMHRVGFSCDTEERAAETVEAICAIAADPRLHLGGIFTHFACCDDEMLDGLAPVPEGKLTEIQYARYCRVLDALEARGIDPGLRHASNSAAILGFPAARLDAVRAGIILYGLSPDSRPWTDDRFCPVMTLETTVAHIQTLLPGEHVSYGAKYTAGTPRTIATLPIGYADGWIRAYSGAMVRVGGHDCPIVGRICMDQCMADITGYEDDIHTGDPVLLFGGDRGERIGALAGLADTIVYECTCQVSRRVVRREIF